MATDCGTSWEKPSFLPHSKQSPDAPRHKLARAASISSLKSAFSYISSSTMTATDVPGTGRILDKFVFTRGGRALESSLARIAHVAGYGPAAAALRIGANLRGFSLHEDESAEALLASGINAPRNSNLRLELGLVHDVSRLRADCKKLFRYTQSKVPSTRIQALNMIITLFIRFPYLSYYFDIYEVTSCMEKQSERRDPSENSISKEGPLIHDLAQMAYACLAPAGDLRSVARFLDHIAEVTKRAEELKRPFDTGPVDYLPDGGLIYKYCTSPETSFAALRFTGLIFQHTFLTGGERFYVKYNKPTASFWGHLFDCITFHVESYKTHACTHCGKHNGHWAGVSIGVDAEGVDLFSETILEMLFRAITWDSHFRPTLERITLMRNIVSFFKSKQVQELYPSAAYVAQTKLDPRLSDDFVVTSSKERSHVIERLD